MMGASRGVRVRSSRRRPVTAYAALSGIFLAAQVALTDFGEGQDGQKVFWLVVGVLLLSLVVRRRSRVARAFVVVTSLIGAVIYALVLFTYPAGPLHAAALSALFFGQAVPMMARPVRDHVRADDRSELTPLSGDARPQAQVNSRI